MVTAQSLFLILSNVQNITLDRNIVLGKSELDKNIILNSLIAEKLISIDNGGKNNKNLEIIGRKEQKMRELQYNTEVVNNINIEHLSENIYRKCLS